METKVYKLICLAILPFSLMAQDLETLFTQGMSKATMSVTYMNQGHLETAKKLSKEASAIYSRIGFIEGYIHASNVVARIHLQSGEPDSARIVADRNMQIVRANDYKGVTKAGTYFIKGATALSLGKIDSSLLFLNSSKQIFDTLSNYLFMPEYLPDSLNFINSVVSSNIGRLVTELTKNSTVAKVYNFLGFAYLATLEFDKAELYYKKALAMYKETNSLPEQFSAYTNLGLAYEVNSKRTTEARFDSTIAQYQAALKLAEQGGSQAIFFKGYAQRLIAMAGLKFNKIGVLKEYYPPAYEILSNNQSGYIERMTLHPSELIQFSLIVENALVNATIGQPDTALTYLAKFEKEIDALEEAGIFIEKELFVHINISAAQTYSLLKDWPNAHLAIKRALRILEIPINDYAHPVFNPASFRPKPQTIDARVLYNIARLFEEQAKHSQSEEEWQSAYDYYQLAMKYLDESRFYYLGVTGQTFFNEEALLNADALLQLVNDGLIRIGAKLASVPVEELLQHFERGKAFVLRHAIARLTQFRSVPDSIFARDQYFKEELGVLQRKIRRERNKVQYDSLNGEWDQVQLRYKEFLKALSKSYPEYYSLKYKEYILSSQEAFALLPEEGTAAIEYDFSDDGKLNIVWLTKDTMAFEQIDLPEDFFDLIHDFKVITKSINSADKAEVLERYFKCANRLYELLLTPVCSKVKNLHHLIIVPDENLHNIEFDYLLTNPVDTAISVEAFVRNPTFNKLDFLVYKMSCQYTNSLSTLVSQNKLGYSRENEEKWLEYGLFQPNFEGFSWKEDLPFFPIENSNSRLGELLDIENIISDLPNPKRYWTAKEATMIKFREAIDSFNFNILHIYSHGLLHPQDPLASGFLLAKSQGQHFRDMVKISDLYNFSIRANLVIMNSCDSGNSSVLEGGEGLISMGRGLFYSGCPSLLLGRWPLVSKSSKNITRGFLQHLNEDMTISKALQQAKIDYLNNTGISKFDKAPFFWAGLSCWGVDQLL